MKTALLRSYTFPSLPFLTGVDLRLTISAGSTVELNVRSGTATTPGPVLASTSAVPGNSGIQYVHLDLPAALAVSPGAMLVLEIPHSYSFVWWGTCAAVTGSCTSIDPDLYPSGQPSGFGGVGDFGFRTYGSSTAPSGEILWGDSDCDGSVDSIDALKDLRHVIPLSVVQVEPCPDIGTPVEVAGGSPHPFADSDCDGSVDSIDALNVLRHVASLPVSQNEPCPAIGMPVQVTLG